jgi:hypothetical protein
MMSTAKKSTNSTLHESSTKLFINFGLDVASDLGTRNCSIFPVFVRIISSVA